jgi:RNA polymerase sigma factor (sigma-70 family)
MSSEPGKQTTRLRRTPVKSRLEPHEVAALVAAAAAGDRGSWEQLVDAYVGLIWAIARGYRLSDGDAHDVTQTTWLRLVEHIDRLSDPSRVGAWLATTTRRECLRVLRQSRREVLLAAWDDIDDAEPDADPVDAALIRGEQAVSVREAVSTLNPRCQALLEMLVLDPPPSYEEVSAALGMPIGSIGPTRGRCLRRLRLLLDERRIADTDGFISSVEDAARRGREAS